MFQTYSCGTCLKTYRLRQSLHYHLKKFVNHRALRATHGKDELTCRFCGTTFTCRQNIVKHIILVHGMGEVARGGKKKRGVLGKRSRNDDDDNNGDKRRKVDDSPPSPSSGSDRNARNRRRRNERAREMINDEREGNPTFSLSPENPFYLLKEAFNFLLADYRANFSENDRVPDVALERLRPHVIELINELLESFGRLKIQICLAVYFYRKAEGVENAKPVYFKHEIATILNRFEVSDAVEKAFEEIRS